jgi:hypothetical protein
MNKKFFTLIAGCFMLAASLGTHAQTTINLGIAGGSAVDKLPYGNSGKLYWLSATATTDGITRVLSVDPNGNLFAYPANQYAGTYGESLWCVSISREDQGANPKFDFSNKAHGDLLSVSEEDTISGTQVNLAHANLSGWGFSKTYENSLQPDRVFSTYYTADTVLVLTLLSDSKVGVKKFPADQLETTIVTSDPDVLKFTVWTPAEVILNANDFNTLLNTTNSGYQSLTFKPDRNNTQLKNPWSDYKLKAYDVAGGNWLKFEVQNPADANHTWLRVDTAYTGDYGTRFLKFAFGPVPTTVPVLENQYYFQLRYYVSNDSLAIDVKQAIFKPEGSTDLWRDITPTVWGAGNGEEDSLHVKLQDLSTADGIRIITIGTEPVSTKVELGIGGCAPTGTNLTSVPNDLYTIKNHLNQYLIIPIYTDTANTSDTSPKWVTLPANVDPNRIPAYQWAVVKTRTSNPEVSPVSIYNREFPEIFLQSVQLRTNERTSLPPGWGSAVTAGSFIAVPAAEKADPYLGYKHLSANDARFNTYVFNYLHEFDATKFLDVKEIGIDTSLYVADDRTQFELIPYHAEAGYGYYTTAITGLAQLKKQPYTIRVKDVSRLRNTGKLIAKNREDRFVVNGSVGANDTVIFHLKTNNTKGEVDYYALLDTVANPVVTKVGIDDNSLWAYVQVQKETRTSAFSVVEWSEPVYRRFDGGVYGYNQVQEPINQETPGKNTPVWLKFTKVNNYAKEYLFENSPLGLGNDYPNTTENDYRQGIRDTSISFLGLYNSVQYPERGDKFNYTFYVDTAYVARPVTASATGENTPKPQYLLAIRPEIKPADSIFHQRIDSTWTSEGVLQVTPGPIDTIIRPAWTRAFYVFNAQDSIVTNTNPRNADYVGKFEYGAEFTTRLAFVDGIHLGDTFYVLPARFKNRAIEVALEDLYAIPAYHKHWLGENTHYKVRWERTGTPGINNNARFYEDGRNGKSMVFQFRLTEPEKNRNFLIESQQADGIEIAPQRARWLKIQNGVPVISDPINWAEAIQNGAEIFDVLPGEENQAVANEAAPAAVSAVKVISEVGALNILNAADKKVTISNILGQTVASSVLTSDNARVALPKGIVIVAVEGEAAVKAIVK